MQQVKIVQHHQKQNQNQNQSQNQNRNRTRTRTRTRAEPEPETEQEPEAAGSTPPGAEAGTKTVTETQIGQRPDQEEAAADQPGQPPRGPPQLLQQQPEPEPEEESYTEEETSIDNLNHHAVVQEHPNEQNNGRWKTICTKRTTTIWNE